MRYPHCSSCSRILSPCGKLSSALLERKRSKSMYSPGHSSRSNGWNFHLVYSRTRRRKTMTTADNRTRIAPVTADKLIVRVLSTASLVGSTQNSSLLMPMTFLFSSLVGDEQTTLLGFMILFLTDFNQSDIQLASQKHFHGFLLKPTFVFTRFTVATKGCSDCS